MWHPVVVASSFVNVPAFVLTDEHHFFIAQFAKARQYGSVVPNGLIAVQFDEFIKDQFDVIQNLRPFCVTSA